MADQLTVLQLVLDHLNLDGNISTIDDRIAIQKAVCLTQEAGLQLGYGFNWYVRGPYSPSLTSDYYQIAGSRSAVEKDAQKFTLTASALRSLSKVQAVFNPPVGCPLGRVQWLELLASVAFLVRRYQMSKEAAEEKIRISKPVLHPYFKKAYKALKDAEFLG